MKWGLKPITRTVYIHQIQKIHTHTKKTAFCSNTRGHRMISIRQNPLLENCINLSCVRATRHRTGENPQLILRSKCSEDNTVFLDALYQRGYAALLCVRV